MRQHSFKQRVIDVGQSPTDSLLLVVVVVVVVVATAAAAAAAAAVVVVKTYPVMLYNWWNINRVDAVNIVWPCHAVYLILG